MALPVLLHALLSFKGGSSSKEKPIHCFSRVCTTPFVHTPCSYVVLNGGPGLSPNRCGSTASIGPASSIQDDCSVVKIGRKAKDAKKKRFNAASRTELESDDTPQFQYSSQTLQRIVRATVIRNRVMRLCRQPRSCARLWTCEEGPYSACPKLPYLQRRVR